MNLYNYTQNTCKNKLKTKKHFGVGRIGVVVVQAYIVC